jgi:hypothetical protein
MVIVIKFICNTAFIYSNIASKTEFHAQARLARLYPPPPMARILPLQYSSAIIIPLNSVFNIKKMSRATH